MDDEIEDIRKLDEILKKETENQNNLQEEFDDFLNCISDDDEALDGFETDNLDFEEFDVNRLDEIASSYYDINNSHFSSDINIIKHYLKKEEIKIINACKDPELKRIMVLNRVKHVQLQHIHIKLYETLRKCSIAIKDSERKIKEFCKNQPSSFKSIIPRLGHPYFKTKDSTSCFPNSDILRKRKNKELSIDYLPQSARWTLEDQIVLNRAVTFNYHSTRIEQLENKLKTLYATKKMSADQETSDCVSSDIDNHEVELSRLKNCKDPDPPPLNCKENINWVYVSNQDLNGRHSPQACQAFWNIYLHPFINKLNWSEDENKAIQVLVEKYNYQNWEAIASDLQKNRTGFSVCVHYYAKLNEKFKKDRFEPEEDAFLLEIVEACRIGNYIPWTKVAHYFDNRTKCQIYHRYRYYLMYVNVTKGAFSEAEDVLLLCLIDKFGTDFSKCACYIQNRSPTQLSHRYNNYLKRDCMNFGNWTVAEDRTILEHVREHGAQKWGMIVGILRRNRTHVRQRYIVIDKWLANNPKQTIEQMPRRKQIYKQKGDFKTIRTTANLFKDSNEIPSLEMIKAHLKIVDKNIVLKGDVKRDNNLVDAELINFFQSTCKIKTARRITEENLHQVISTIKTILTIMDVALEIPNENTMNDNQLLDELDIGILRLLRQDPIISSSPSLATPLPSSSHSNQLTLIPNSNITFAKSNLLQNITLLPPNINTLVGLRSMLLTSNLFKKRIQTSSAKTNLNEAKNKFVWSTEQALLKLDDSLRVKFKKEQELFEKRFKILFKWPCLMSVVEPHEKLNLLNSLPFVEDTSERFLPKIGRPRKDLSKINLMLKAKQRKVLEKNKDAKVIEISDETKVTNNQPKILNGLDTLNSRIVLQEVANAQSDQGMVLENPKLHGCNRTIRPNIVYINTVHTNDVNNFVTNLRKNSNAKFLVQAIQHYTTDKEVEVNIQSSVPDDDLSRQVKASTSGIDGKSKPQYILNNNGIDKIKTEHDKTLNIENDGNKRQCNDSVISHSVKKLKSEIMDSEEYNLNKDICMLDDLLSEVDMDN